MLFSHLLTFSIVTFSENYFRNTIRVSNSLDPDQDRHSVGPDLGLNSLQRLSTVEQMTKIAASKERVKLLSSADNQC